MSQPFIAQAGLSTLAQPPSLEGLPIITPNYSLLSHNGLFLLQYWNLICPIHNSGGFSRHSNPSLGRPNIANLNYNPGYITVKNPNPSLQNCIWACYTTDLWINYGRTPQLQSRNPKLVYVNVHHRLDSTTLSNGNISPGNTTSHCYNLSLQTLSLSNPKHQFRESYEVTVTIAY